MSTIHSTQTFQSGSTTSNLSSPGLDQLSSLSTPALTDDDGHSIGSSLDTGFPDSIHPPNSHPTELYSPVFSDGDSLYKNPAAPKLNPIDRPRLLRTVAVGSPIASDEKGNDTSSATNSKDASTPATLEAHDSKDGAQGVSQQDFCSGAYCNFVVPDTNTASHLQVEKPPRKDSGSPSDSDSKDASTPSTDSGLPSDNDSKDGSTPNTVESHANRDAAQSLSEQDFCSGAYCNFVVPDKDTISQLQLEKPEEKDFESASDDDSKDPSTPTALQPTPAEDAAQGVSAQDTCSGAYCNLKQPPA
ncbi:hypothetical protein CALVIDRAFT_553855 [Calocera viscosa TUFC12733]|uniref:Uncharacterized protein n=1 Tax=Calocera viscosa (strain TUFC12733) TaxID=1330018 RepID=A0A167PB51_CALVF|nr:hypothetical protein CALVIDRAFT_553855 [Calocera viscosa TUFC12733]